MARKPKVTPENVIAALQKANGLQAGAARLLDVSCKTIANYIEKDAKVKAAYDDVNETTIDKVEDRLLAEINKGNITAIIFYLKTKAKHRGFVERQEIAGADDKPIKVIVEYADTNGNKA